MWLKSVGSLCVLRGFSNLLVVNSLSWAVWTSPSADYLELFYMVNVSQKGQTETESSLKAMPKNWHNVTSATFYKSKQAIRVMPHTLNGVRSSRHILCVCVPGDETQGLTHARPLSCI